MKYSELKKQARSIANNQLLVDWSSNAPQFSFKSYNLMINNLRHWLAPTVNRLDCGLTLLKGDLDKSGAIDKIIHAFEHNIEDERGNGKDTAHAFLFNKSARTYGEVIYAKELTFGRGLPSTMRLKERSSLLFQENLYVMLGAALAQEIHALPQLELLLKGNEINKHKFSDDEWQDVFYFYDIHLDGTEARHAEDLNQSIWKLIDTSEKESKFKQGFDELLHHLDEFWMGMASEVH